MDKDGQRWTKMWGFFDGVRRQAAIVPPDWVLFVIIILFFYFYPVSSKEKNVQNGTRKPYDTTHTYIHELKIR